MKVYYVLAIPVALNMMGPWPVVVLYLIRRMMIRRKNKNVEDELHHGGGNMEDGGDGKNRYMVPPMRTAPLAVPEKTYITNDSIRREKSNN